MLTRTNAFPFLRNSKIISFVFVHRKKHKKHLHSTIRLFPSPMFSQWRGDDRQHCASVKSCHATVAQHTTKVKRSERRENAAPITKHCVIADSAGAGETLVCASRNFSFSCIFHGMYIIITLKFSRSNSMYECTYIKTSQFACNYAR